MTLHVPSFATRRLMAALCLFAAALGGCKAEPLAPALTVVDFIPRVAAADGSIVATLQHGDLPAASGGPIVSASGIGTVINGGSSQVLLAAGSSSFQRVYVGVRGYQDYWQLDLPAGVSTSDIVVGIGAELPATTFNALFAVSSGGTVGAYAAQSLRVIRVGTGDVQVSVSWTGASDVDLHVVDPNGVELYYGNKKADSGGELDLDSNAGCQLDHVNNENIVFPTGAAPRGEYIVRVDYWNSCSVPRSDYVVTVQAKGQTPRVFTGSFTGNGDAGGSGSGVEIARFTY